MMSSWMSARNEPRAKRVASCEWEMRVASGERRVAREGD